MSTVREVARVLRTDSNVMRTDVPLEVEQDVLHVFLNHQEHQVRHRQDRPVRHGLR